MMGVKGFCFLACAKTKQEDMQATSTMEERNIFLLFTDSFTIQSGYCVVQNYLVGVDFTVVVFIEALVAVTFFTSTTLFKYSSMFE